MLYYLILSKLFFFSFRKLNKVEDSLNSQMSELTSFIFSYVVNDMQKPYEMIGKLPDTVLNDDNDDDDDDGNIDI